MLTTRAFLGILGGIAILAGIIGLSTDVSATGQSTSYVTGYSGTSTVSCGSVWSPSNPDATDALGTYTNAGCTGAIDGRQAWAWPAFAVGLAAVAGAWLMRANRRLDAESGSGVGTVGEAG